MNVAQDIGTVKCQDLQEVPEGQLALSHNSPPTDLVGGDFGPMKPVDIDNPLDHVSLGFLEEHIQIARRAITDGQLYKGTTEYIGAIRIHINSGGSSDDRLLKRAMTEVIECFDQFNKEAVSLLSRYCSDLIEEASSQPCSRTTMGCLLSSALQRLLKIYPEAPYIHFNIPLIVDALNDDRDIDKSMRMALYSFLEGVRRFRNKKRSIKEFQLTILSFAIILRGGLPPKSIRMSKDTVSRLYNATSELLRMGRWIHDDIGVVLIWVRKFSSTLKFVMRGFSEDIVGVALVWGKIYIPESDCTIESLITHLAAGCSALYWLQEADTLFSVIRNPQTMELVNLSRSQISLQFCLHLERCEHWVLLADFIPEAYDELSNIYDNMDIINFELICTPLKTRKLIAWMRDLIKGTPWEFTRPGKAVASLTAIEAEQLKRILAEDVLSLVASDTEQNRRENNDYEGGEEDRHGEEVDDVVMVEEGDKNTIEDNDSDMEDWKSSNRFGLTYTESIITDISFNYSALYK
jgi:hypothetical protein